MAADDCPSGLVVYVNGGDRTYSGTFMSDVAILHAVTMCNGIYLPFLRYISRNRR